MSALDSFRANVFSSLSSSQQVYFGADSESEIAASLPTDKTLQKQTQPRLYAVETRYSTQPDKETPTTSALPRLPLAHQFIGKSLRIRE